MDSGGDHSVGLFGTANSSLADTELEENQVEAIAEEEGSSLPKNLLDGETEEEGLKTTGLETRRRPVFIPRPKPRPKPAPRPAPRPAPKPKSKPKPKTQPKYTADPKNDGSWNQFTKKFLDGIVEGVGSELVHQAVDMLLTCRQTLIEKNSSSLSDCIPFINFQNYLQEKETNGQEDTTDVQDETSDGQYDTSNLDERWNSDPGMFAQQPPIQDAVNVSGA
ncbi:hypothetical protein J6590_056672 [Homalodisca vitripennis]|nr:hypothetical protein J6590_056672 [Homalodisca vitripennis]